MDKQFGFDPQLPDLALAFDRDAVARLFERQWPGRDDGGPPRITKVKSQDIKYQPGVRCVTTYELLAERDNARRSARSAWSRSGPTAWRTGSPTTTHACPGWPTPSTPWRCSSASPRCWPTPSSRAAQLRPCAIALACAACSATIFRPGRAARCSSASCLARAASSCCPRSARLHAAGGVQVNAPDGAARMPRILRPLAYWPDIRMLVQAEVVGGAELNDLALRPGPGCRPCASAGCARPARAWLACTRRRWPGRRAPWPTIWPSLASMSRPWRSPTRRWRSATSRRWRIWPSGWPTRHRRAAPRTAPSAPTSL